VTGPEHYKEGERLLSQASYVRSDNNHEPVHADGEPMPPAVHAALTARANTHFAAALAAATALQAALPLIGDDQQVTEWGRAVGTAIDTNQGARISSALAILDDLEARVGITWGAANKLREALGQQGGARR
jgi:hypothetical protein